MVAIEARALGKKRPIVPPFSIEAPAIVAPGEDVRLRDLIAGVVKAEVAAFKERAERRAFLRVLSASEIDDGAARGKVDMGGREQNAEVDVDEAVANALLAFEDGLYLVLVDEAETKDLDAAIDLKDDSSVVFLRLAFLAGA